MKTTIDAMKTKLDKLFATNDFTPESITAIENLQESIAREEEQTVEPVKKWPFAETVGEFTSRLSVAYSEFGTLLAAVRCVLIENPPTFTHPAPPPSGDRAALIKRLLTSWEAFTPSDKQLHKDAADMLAADAQQVAVQQDKQADRAYVNGLKRGHTLGHLGREDEYRAEVASYMREIDAAQQVAVPPGNDMVTRDSALSAIDFMDYSNCSGRTSDAIGLLATAPQPPQADIHTIEAKITDRN